MIITFGLHDTFLGRIIIGRTERGLCWLGFMVDGYKGDGVSRMEKHFPAATFIRDEVATKPMMDQIIKAWQTDSLRSIPLDLHGTEFQVSVWQALLDIPTGQVCSYSAIAKQIGKPNAQRAVGSAVGENPVSLVVPCHRVIKSDGSTGNYGWGTDLKKELLEQEQAAFRLDKAQATKRRITA